MKKAVTKLALLFILASSLIPVLSFAPIVPVTAKEQSFLKTTSKTTPLERFLLAADGNYGTTELELTSRLL